jgi:hypothetical protein
MAGIPSMHRLDISRILGLMKSKVWSDYCTPLSRNFIFLVYQYIIMQLSLPCCTEYISTYLHSATFSRNRAPNHGNLSHFLLYQVSKTCASTNRYMSVLWYAGQPEILDEILDRTGMFLIIRVSRLVLNPFRFS